MLVSSLPQLGALTTAPSGLSYYPLLPHSLVIDAGTNAVLPTIAAAEGVSPATDEIGDPRVVRRFIDMGAIEFPVRPRTPPSGRPPPPSAHSPP
jgi:hypothetical protein